jgi:PAS domain S-box-containing protein
MKAAQDIFDLLQESLTLRDRDGRIVEWNAASERIYGWSRAQAIGQSIHDLLKTPPETVACIDSGLRERGTWEGNAIRRTATGIPITLSLKCALRSRGDAGQVLETGIEVGAHRHPLEMPAPGRADIGSRSQQPRRRAVRCPGCAPAARAGRARLE